MNQLEQILASQYIEQHLNAIRYSATLEKDAIAQLMELNASIKSKFLDFDPQTRQEYEELIKEVTGLINSSVGEISASQIASLKSFSVLSAKATAKAFNDIVGISLMKQPNRLSSQVAGMVINGAPSADWWRGIAERQRDVFAQTVRRGFISGETTEQIARSLVGKRGEQGALDMTLRNARSLVQTSVQVVANESKREVFKSNSDLIQGEIWLATLDSSTCIACGGRDKKLFSLDGKPIGHTLSWSGGPASIHFKCRCTSTPKVKSFRDLGIDIDDFTGSTRASMDGQVSNKLDFESWLQTKSESFQAEYFGVDRLKLWRSKQITLSDLMDMRGRPLTLKQLEAKYS